MSSLHSRRQFLLLLSCGAVTAACSPIARRSLPNSNATDNAESQIDDASLRFVVVGDVGRGNRGQYAVAKAMERHYQAVAFPLVLLMGDNIYEDGEVEKLKRVFERPYRNLLKQDVQFRAVLGNHDIRENDGDQQVVYAPFNMDGRYYRFREGPVEFFALETNKDAAWPEQLAWLEAALAGSDAPWKIVYGHHPIFSSGKHGNHPRLQETLCPLFKQYGVQLYCCGHDHHYERTHDIDGTTYLIAGGGSETRPVGQSSWTAYAEKVLSFASVEVSDAALVITGFDSQSQVIDQGRIVRVAEG